MIGANLEQSRKIHDRLLGLTLYARLPAAIANLCGALAETAVDPDFPGALVPSLDTAEILHVLIVCPRTIEWRRLSPIMRAFAGPTLTSFKGLQTLLPATEPSAVEIASSEPAATAAMLLPGDDNGRLLALRALVRARDTLSRAPPMERSAPESTSWLLAQFQDHLNVGRRDAAAKLLGRLQSDLRLDALNLKFLEVQLLATFAAWSSIVNLPGFDSLCLARRAPATTAALLEALYYVHLDTAFSAGERGTTRTLYEECVRPFAQPLMNGALPEALTGKGAWRILGLETLVAPGRNDLRLRLRDREETLGWIAVAIATPLQAPTPNHSPEAPLDIARGALVEIGRVESVEALASVLSSLRKLSADEMDRLRQAEPFRSLLHSLADEESKPELPASWTEWLAAVINPDFTNALEIARHGKDEWAIDAATADPVAVENLVAALDGAQNIEIAAQRTSQALPFIVAWLRRDSSFPRPALVPVYANLLTLFALASARGRSIYKSSQILISALLTSGLDARAYRALIADVDELAGEGFGVDMIYWMLEIIEDFMRAGAPDAEARHTFLQGALSRMTPLFIRLSSLQRAAIARLASELGWDAATFSADNQIAPADVISARMQGLRIAIYSLTETSSQQAKIAIEEAVSTAVVECNADHGGTNRLRSLARNTDLFVVVWQSAKHAATDFIRQHRGDRPLIYAQGRGFSSILRAIEDHLVAHRL